MSTIHNISYEDALKFLNSLSEDELTPVFHQYNEKSTDGLADIISDNDLYALGYGDKEEEISESFDYKYSDIDSICEFLAHEIEPEYLQSLMKHYDCFTVDDLALCLTDDELADLGYGCCDDTKETEKVEFLPPHKLQEYDETLDFFEDIPMDSIVYIIDKDNGIFATDNEAEYYNITNYLDPVLIDECFGYFDENYNKFIFNVKKHDFEDKEQVSEEVIINDKLNSNIFDSENKMLPEIREQLLNYVNNFINAMNEKGVEINYSDICLVGSNAGYLYTPESDIDVHIISANPIDLDNAEGLFNEFDNYENENPLNINGNQVEIGIEDGYDVVMDNKDARKYSIVDDIWVNDSDKEEVFKPEDINKVEGYEQVVDDYTNKIHDVIQGDEYAQAVLLKQEIRQNRSNDLANIGSLSMGNVVFKELRNNGAYGELKDYIATKELGDIINE